MPRKLIVPTVLVKTKQAAKDRVKKVKRYVERIQFDIIDGKFVHNKTIGLSALKDVNLKGKKIEMHLMVKNPEKYVEQCYQLGVFMFIFHYEAAKNIDELIKKVKNKKMKVGIAINPETSASMIKKYLKKIDQILVMTVIPGFGGQEFMSGVLEKVKQIRKWNQKIAIEVDGGIHPGTACLAKKAGANVFSVGSAIFGSKDIKKAFKEMEKDIK